MKSLDSREMTNEFTGFLYLWRNDKFLRLGRIFDIGPQYKRAKFANIAEIMGKKLSAI